MHLYTPMLRLFILFYSCFALVASAATPPKREFRGAWLQTAYQSQYTKMERKEAQTYLKEVLTGFQQIGINAVIFQARPQADAFYDSELEPWSHFFTGTQGKAPSPKWDMLEFLVEECHARGMELHAWLNPYRVTTNPKNVLSKEHIYYKHPEWFVSYNKNRYFDPGIPACRAYICSVVDDIVTRYDVDAIHMDDYFYPYPVGGLPFPDDKSFATYGMGGGYSNLQRDDWRRENVNLLIKELNHTIKQRKPWVQFGISPFGIYRNQKSDPNGSDSNGLQNYDNLYADVLKWGQEGWIDYLIPQLYWEIGHTHACSEKLLYWWGKQSYKCRLYIGQSVVRSCDAPDMALPNQFYRKMVLSREQEGVMGNCFWSGYDLAQNYKESAHALQSTFHTTPSLIPSYPTIDGTTPPEVTGLRTKWTLFGRYLSWKRTTNPKEDGMQYQYYFAIYRFKMGEAIDLNNASRLIEITNDTEYLLPYTHLERGDYIYVVTALDRAHNESPLGESIRVTL